MASMFDTLASSLAGAAGDIFSTGLNLVGQGILNNQNNNAAMDRQQQSQQGATVGVQGSTNKTDATSKEQSTTSQNTNITGKEDTVSNTTQSETERLISEILNNKNVDEATKSQLQQMLQGTTNVTAGNAQSNAALNQLLTGMLDPSQYSPEKAQAAATDMMKVASQQIMQSGIGDVLGQGATTGTFGSTVQAQLSNDLLSKAQLGATQAGNAVLGQYSEMRNKETAGLLEAIKAAQTGNQSTTTNQSQNQTGSTSTNQSTVDKTGTTQDKTGNISSNTTGSTASTGTSNTNSSTSASGSSSQTSTGVEKEVSASSNKSFDDWIKANMPKS